MTRTAWAASSEGTDGDGDGGACAACSDANLCTDDACAAGSCPYTNNGAIQSCYTGPGGTQSGCEGIVWAAGSACYEGVCFESCGERRR